MKVIIAGPHKGVWDIAIIERAVLESGFAITEVVSGRAPGIDTLGERWADKHGIPVQPFPAGWTRYGKKSAGRIRNAEMGAYAEALIAIDAGTPGTTNMIDIMKGLKKPYYALKVDSLIPNPDAVQFRLSGPASNKAKD